MTDDLISRQAAINVADGADYTGLSVEDVKKVTDEVVKGLKKLPSAQPEMKRGKWIWVDGVRCSNCNHKLQTTGLPSFCPNCGAEMEANDGGIHQN